MGFYGKKYIKGFQIDIIGFEKETDRLLYISGSNTRKAKRNYICSFGGNPYPGTIIEFYNIVLPNGKKAKYNIYA